MTPGSQARSPQILFRDIQRCLEDAQTRALKLKGRLRQDADEEAVQDAMGNLQRLHSAFREAMTEQVYSVRVSKILEDFKGMANLLRSFLDEPMTHADLDRFRNRILGWHYESRRWIGDLPMQDCVRRLPPSGENSGEERAAELKRVWLNARGAWFGDPHHRPTPPNQVPPLPFLTPSLEISPSSVIGPLESRSLTVELDPDGDASHWIVRPQALLELLEWAQEALLLEAGGQDRGGNTSFAQRRRKSSLKDAFALSCLLIYEKAVGSKSARQGLTVRRENDPTPFEKFVALVHEWIVGADAPRDWALGPDPIRKAIHTVRAWQKLFKATGTDSAESFYALPLKDREAALRLLKPKERTCLAPAAPPLI